MPATPLTDLPALHHTLLTWYDAHARDLPWRRPEATAWAVLVSEVMLQQTPVVRVEPAWRTWMERWPEPGDLAAAEPAEVLRAWDRLGYPRRALRLRECAAAITERHGGVVPEDEDELRALPGVGEYTAAAVRAFAYRRRAVVLDTNVRRVLGRVADGVALPPPSLGRAERERAAALVPEDAETSARWNVAVMELGALVCTARSPRCSACPVQDRCAWLAAGRPEDAHADRRRTQGWHGTDRQARGRIMAALRDAEGALTPEELLTAAAGGAAPEALDDPGRPARALASLVTDGLAVAVEGGYRLP